MNGKDYVKETKEYIDYLIKEAINTMLQIACTKSYFKKFSWIDEKLSARRVEKRKI